MYNVLYLLSATLLPLLILLLLHLLYCLYYY